MAEGINMGRKSPWTKEEYVKLYNTVVNYAKALSVQLLREEGAKSASEALSAYNMFKYPIVYLFLHYHYGKFEDLGMDSNDTTTYIMMFAANVKYMASGILDGLKTENVFYYDYDNVISPKLREICEEVLYIENNF